MSLLETIKQKLAELWPSILETIVTLVLLHVFIVKAIVMFFVPDSMKSKELSGETVLITGAGSGLGRLLSIKLARLGCTLVLWDINNKSNEETAEEVAKTGAKAYTYSVDVSSREEIYKAAKKTQEQVGDVTMLINNAGIVTGKKLLDAPDHLIQKTFDVNTTAHFWTTKAFLPSMMEKNHGHIVTIASSAGFAGVNGLVDYCASKFGAVGFHESLSLEMMVKGKDGVMTTCVCPYVINTGMFTGAKSKWPTLLPELDQDYVTDKIVTAIRIDQRLLILPRILYFALALKPFLPTDAQYVLAKYMGINEFMDEFKGRGAKKEN